MLIVVLYLLSRYILHSSLVAVTQRLLWELLIVFILCGVALVSSDQCAQIGRFLKVLASKFDYKSSLKHWWLFWAILKRSTLWKNCCGIYLDSFWKHLGYIFTPISGHTVSDILFVTYRVQLHSDCHKCCCYDRSSWWIFWTMKICHFTYSLVLCFVAKRFWQLLCRSSSRFIDS